VITSGGSGLCRWPMIPDPTQPGGFRLGPAQTLNANPLGRACLSRDGRLLAVGDQQGHALIYDLDKAAAPVVCGIHPSLISVAFSPDNRWLASGAWQGRSVIIWDARSGKRLHALPVAAGAQVEFSPDGRLLVTATDEEICLWNTKNWEPGLRFRRERSGPVAFSPRGDMLAIAHSLSKIRLLHPDSGQEYATLETPYPLGMSGLHFSQDGSQLAVATDYMTQLWDLRRLRQELSTVNLDWNQVAFPRPRMECRPCLK